MAVTIVVNGGKVTVSTDDKASDAGAVQLVEAWKKEDLQKDGMAKLALAGRKAPLVLVEPLTAPAKKLRKPGVKRVSIASLREVALALGINTEGLGKKAIQERLDKVLGLAAGIAQKQEATRERVIEGYRVVGLKPEPEPPSIQQIPIESLRQKARDLGINTYGLGGEEKAHPGADRRGAEDGRGPADPLVPAEETGPDLDRKAGG